VTEEHVGGQRWRSTGGRPRQLKEVTDSLLRWLLEADGGSMADSRGSEVHESGAGWSVLGAEERDDERAEADDESKAEWVTFVGCRGKRRDDFSHGPTA
jgi:hypothetical protein